jgi:magnesium-transporting ATPase (P-type)
VSLPPFWSEPAERLFERLRSRAAGLRADEAAARLREHGPNALRPPARLAALRLLLRQFASPLVAILVFAALIALLVGDWTDAAMVLAILVGSALLGFCGNAGPRGDGRRARVRSRPRATDSRHPCRRSFPATWCCSPPAPVRRTASYSGRATCS